MDVILIIIAIIGGVSTLFKDKGTDQSKKKPYQQSGPTTPVPDSSQKKQNEGSRYTPNTETIEMQEQRDAQMHQLAERMNIGTQENEEEHKANPANDLQETSKQDKIPNTVMQKRIRNNLNRKGLVDGIIMSEVLGPPRARKPYQSVIVKRSK